MTRKFKEINEEELECHFNLEKGDRIYHLEYYKSGGTYQQNPGNDLILNLKKSVDKKGTTEWSHKQKAILTIAKDIVDELNNPDENKYRRIYWIPVPPSKVRTDPMFDDRVYQILVMSINTVNDNRHFVADVIYQKESRDAFSSKSTKRRVKDLVTNYEMNEIPNYDPKTDLIVIFDDVITSGCHYKAVERKILEKYSNAVIMGIFVARTTSRDESSVS